MSCSRKKPIVCLRCKTNLAYVGTREFHEGERWGILGNIGELFVNREKFDVYICSHCGRVEFFLNGIGEELRTQ